MVGVFIDSSIQFSRFSSPHFIQLRDHLKTDGDICSKDTKRRHYGDYEDLSDTDGMPYFDG